MCNAELSVYFAFLVLVGVVACIFASCVALLALCDHASPALSAGALGTSFCAASYNTAIFPPFCGAPSVGVPSPGEACRPFLRPRAEAASPYPHSVTGSASWHMGGS